MMFDFDSVQQAVDFDGIESEPRLSAFDYGEKNASDSFASSMTDVAISKIADYVVRQRIRMLLKPSVASRLAGLELVATASGAQSAWLHFVTKSFSDGHQIKLAGGRHLSAAAITVVGPLDFDQTLYEPLRIGEIESLTQETSPDEIPSEDVNDGNVAFVASIELLKSWVDGLNAIRAEGKHEALKPVTSDTQKSYADELTRQLRKVISNFAKRKSYEHKAYRITFGGEFLPSFEGLIEDHLMIPPRNAVAFLDIFKGELYRQSTEHAVFSGRWGELIIDHEGELLLKLQKRRARNLSSVLKGR